MGARKKNGKKKPEGEALGFFLSQNFLKNFLEYFLKTI